MNDGADTVKVEVNGESTATAEGIPLLGLLEKMGLNPIGIMIERNGEVLLRSEWAEVRVTAGDRLEILRVVAGG